MQEVNIVMILFQLEHLTKNLFYLVRVRDSSGQISRTEMITFLGLNLATSIWPNSDRGPFKVLFRRCLRQTL